MQELRAVISDEEFATLEHLAQNLGVSLEELVRQSLATYLTQATAEPIFQPIGFGMGANRLEMQDAAKRVAELRHREWTRSCSRIPTCSSTTFGGKKPRPRIFTVGKEFKRCTEVIHLLSSP
jgi:hypothetical protein